MKQNNPIVAIQLFRLPESSNELFEVISAEAILVRADHIGDETEIKRISLTNGVKIYSLKSEREGGKFNGSIEKRHQLLLESLDHYDVIELEAETDLTENLLSRIPSSRRIISWQGPATSLQELEDRYVQMTGVEARFYQIILEPKTISQGIWPLQLLNNKEDNKALITFASGEEGIWTQLLSMYLGGAMILGNINKNEEEGDFLTYEQIKEDYNLPKIRKVTTIYGIAGNPVFSSMSPQIHNKCYESLKMEALYLPFHIERFDEFWKFISIDFPYSGLDFTLGGFTMVSPYKEDSFNLAKEHLSEPTLLSKACNILVNNNGDWFSDSSDGLGILAALKEENIDFRGLKIAIIGCGGAGRTIASRLKSYGANIVFYNRSEIRGKFAAGLLDLPYCSILEFEASKYDIIINATPVGKLGKVLIFDPSSMRLDSLAIDMAYAKEDTKLVTACREQGKNIIEGKQILLHQVKKQFTCLTGKEMPIEVEMMVRYKTANMDKMN